MNTIRLKFTAFSIVVILFSFSIQAQDLIITYEGDSLNCKITKIKSENIYFTFNHKGEIRSTLLSLEQVKNYQYKYYQTSEVPTEKITDHQIYPHFRAALTGGWSYRVAPISSGMSPYLEKYMKDLKSGYHYGVDLSYYFSEQLGFGLKGYNYRSKNELNNVSVTMSDGSTQYGTLSDNISISFIGPFFSTRLLDGKKRNSLLLNFGIGYMGYLDKAVLISDFTMKGSTVGLSWDIGYDIGLSKNIAIGFQLSYMIGTLTQYKLSDGINTETIRLQQGNYEGLSRIDVSIGLRFNK